MSANREYKASFFSKLFSEPSRLRELYNALDDTNYGEDTPFEINTLLKMARVLLALNVPVDTIQKASGMTQKEIEKLREPN